jgi:uncharacterized protein YycO
MRLADLWKNFKGSRAIHRVTIVIILAIVVASVVVVRRMTLPTVAVQEDILQQGDILFVNLYKGWSYEGYWDHVALYAGDGVIEATFNGGVCYTPLAEFLDRDWPAGVTVRRLKDNIPNREEIIQKAVDYALNQVGQPFDYTAITPIPLKIGKDRFDCAELVWKAYLAGGVNLDSNAGPLLFPGDIYYSSWLRPI